MVSVILPTYNERENIGELINSVKNAFSFSVEIIVVDDNSADRTWEFVDELSKVNKNIKLIRRIHEKGLASAIREGMAFANGEAIVLMDADLSMPANILMRMAGLLDNFDIVVGSRYIKGAMDSRGSFFRVLCSRIFNLFASRFLNSAVKDLTSGFLVFKKASINPLSIKGKYGEYCIGLLYKAQKDGLSITEFPYNCVSRKRGQTKTSPNAFRFIQYGILYIFAVLKLRFQNA